jgi:hypothetical protein
VGLPVFTPLLNTLWRRDLDKNIPNLIRKGEGVKVFLGISGREKMNCLEIFPVKLQLLTTDPELLIQLPTRFRDQFF